MGNEAEAETEPVSVSVPFCLFPGARAGSSLGASFALPALRLRAEDLTSVCLYVPICKIEIMVMKYPCKD